LNPRRFDLAVFPSLAFESHSLVLDEAIDLGLPVAASRRGALGERSGESGLSFDTGDPESLAARLREVLSRPALLDEARERIVRPASMAAHSEAMEALYADAATRRPRGPARPSDGGDRQRALSLEARNRTIESLRLKALRLAPVLEDLERHRQLRTELEAELFEQRRVIETLGADLEGHRSALLHVREELDRHREAIRDRDADIGRRQAAIESLSAEVKTLSEAAAGLEAEIGRQRESLSAASEDVERHRRILAAREEESIRLAEARDDAMAELGTVNSDREQLLADLARLREAAAAAAADAERTLGRDPDGAALSDRIGAMVRAIAIELDRERGRARSLEEEISRLKEASLPARVRRFLSGLRGSNGDSRPRL
jgi:hypothetical protein